MKFIFPQNYDFKNKLFGMIDYSTTFINLLWDVFILILVNLIFTDLTTKIFIIIICCFPLLLFSLTGFNGENILYVLSYLTRFWFRQKLFLYKKSNK